MMTAARKNITVEQGATFSFTFQLRDQATQQPIDISTATVRAWIKQKKTDSAALVVMTITPLSATQVQLSIPATTTAQLTIDKGVWDLEVQWPTGVVTRYLEGNVVVSKEVTKNV